MKCKNCGSSLKYSQGVYTCESCGRQYAATDFYENIDTYICYVENDEHGRRTKDSIIAQDIYQKLETNKIKTFYSRISAEGLLGVELEQMCNAAIHMAKTIIIFGTQRQYFEVLLEKYSAYFEGKIVIPVYTDMDAYTIPKGISAIQALDYNRVGATVDLIKSLLNALNRENEVDFIMMSEKSTSKRKIVWIVVCAIAVLLGVLTFSVAYIKNKEQNNKNQENVLSPEEMQSSKYKEALSCVEEGDFVKAIKMFSSLGEYKDSQKQLLLLYEKYGGYYKDDKQNITFRLQVWEGNTAGIEVIAINESGVQCSISETSQLKENKLELEFNDSENNKGSIVVELQNEKINLLIDTTNKVSDVSIGNVECAFLVSEKSDKPFAVSLDAETLMGIVKNKTTLSQLKQMGIEVEFISALYKDTSASRYKIKNTEIELAIYNYDITNVGEEGYVDDEPVPSPIVFAISAPAELIAADKIGEQSVSYVDKDVLFIPDAILSQDYYELDFYVKDERETISSSTPICFTSKSLVGEQHFEYLAIRYLITEPYTEQYSIIFAQTEKEEYDKYYMVYVSESDGKAPNLVYKLYKGTYEVELIVD